MYLAHTQQPFIPFFIRSLELAILASRELQDMPLLTMRLLLSTTLYGPGQPKNPQQPRTGECDSGLTSTTLFQCDCLVRSSVVIDCWPKVLIDWLVQIKWSEVVTQVWVYRDPCVCTWSKNTCACLCTFQKYFWRRNKFPRCERVAGIGSSILATVFTATNLFSAGTN